MNFEAEKDIDSDMVELISIRDQLEMCNNLLSDAGNSTNEEANFTANNKMNGDDGESTSSRSNCNDFQVIKDSIRCVPSEDQDEELLGLGVSVYDQTQFENEVMDQVDKAMKAQEEKKRKDEVERELKAVADDIRYKILFRFLNKMFLFI